VLWGMEFRTSGGTSFGKWSSVRRVEHPLGNGVSCVGWNVLWEMEFRASGGTCFGEWSFIRRVERALGNRVSYIDTKL